MKKKINSTFERKYSKYKMMYHKIYTKNIKNISYFHCTLYIRNFLSLENVEISMQVSNRQLFHRNDVEKTFFRGAISDWDCYDYATYFDIVTMKKLSIRNLRRNFNIFDKKLHM